MKIIDVSVLPLDSTLPTYSGNPPFTLETVKRICDRGTSNVSELPMSANPGTHVDAPRHLSGGGPCRLPQRIAGPDGAPVRVGLCRS